MHKVSSAVLSALATVARGSLQGLHRDPPQPIASGVLSLSALFTRGGLGKSRAYLEDARLRASYLSYYVPVNVSKVQALLDELRPTFSAIRNDEFRVLDLGGGPGTGAVATLDWCCSTDTLSPASLRMTVVDHSPQALRLCDEVWNAYGKAQNGRRISSLHTVEHNLEQRLPSRLRPLDGERGYDLIILQNLLSELFVESSDPINQRTMLVATLLEWLARDGSLMIVEPAMRSASRELHQVRDKLLASERCGIYSPCLHDSPCPALIKPDDWCHEERKWETPDWISQIDRQVGFIKDALKFSYVILRKDGKTLVPRNSEYHRVVSELRVMKGEKRVWLCDATGRLEVGRQDKEQSTSNTAFDSWHRGAIVRVSEIVRKNRKDRPAMVGRILSIGEAEIIRPA